VLFKSFSNVGNVKFILEAASLLNVVHQGFLSSLWPDRLILEGPVVKTLPFLVIPYLILCIGVAILTLLTIDFIRPYETLMMGSLTASHLVFEL